MFLVDDEIKQVGFSPLENLLDESSKTRPLTKVEDKIPFGKYKGKTFQNVYSVNPQYVKWLLNNSDTINFDTVSFNSLFREK
jgi:hypothetical protein